MQEISRIEIRIQLRRVRRVSKPGIEIQHGIESPTRSDPGIDRLASLFAERASIGLDSGVGTLEGGDGCGEDGDVEGVAACDDLVVGCDETV